MEKIEEEWEFDELKIIRELAMAAIEQENKAAEVRMSLLNVVVHNIYLHLTSLFVHTHN